MDDAAGDGEESGRGIGLGGGKSRAVEMALRMHLTAVNGTWVSGDCVAPRIIILGIIVSKSLSSENGDPPFSFLQSQLKFAL